MTEGLLIHIKNHQKNNPAYIIVYNWARKQRSEVYANKSTI